MSDSNRVQLASVREVTLGTTPVTPRMRKARYNSAALVLKPDFDPSNEKRDDRMNIDPIKVGESNTGTVNFEFSYPPPGSFHSEQIVSVMHNDWVDTPSRDNDGVADSVITGVAATGGVYTVVTGLAFVIGHLVRASGFLNASNNGLKKITTGSATVPAVGAGPADEASPPANARLKVVGFEGAAGDITALADGLGSTTLDFTTLGLQVGGFVKIGGTGAAYRFAAAALNDWARVVAIATNKLTLDNLPTGWAMDAGTGKTIRVFFGDQIKNGTTIIGSTIERGYLSQAVPTYIAQRGMVIDEANWTIEAKKVITGSYAFIGMGGDYGSVPLDASPDEAPSTTEFPVMAGSANVGRIAESGAPMTGKNYIKSFALKIKNNIRPKEDVENLGPVDIGTGSADVTVNLNTYFGSDGLLAKLFSGAAVNVSARVLKANKAFIMSVPRMTYTDGSPDDGGKNTDVMLPLTASASVDPLTNAHVIFNRLEYYEA